MQATAEATIAAPSPPESTAAAPSIPDEVHIRPISVADYYRMGEAGIFGPEERVELLNGRLIAMPPGGPPHSFAVERVTSYFYRFFSERASIRAQSPLTLDTWSEPEPDVMLSALPLEQYAVAHPTPAEVLLVVEVASSSLRYDTGMKLRAYARRGVREYWIVDLKHEHVDVYREPERDRYKKHRRAGRGKSIAPLAFPDDAVAVSDILPPAAKTRR